jgi:hypothetical protein
MSFPFLVTVFIEDMGCFVVSHAHEELPAEYLDTVNHLISKGYARTNIAKEGFMRIAAFIINQF